jgi:predicted nuclease of predicted toxin-antitoxin system
MNLSPRWARFLAEAGFDATHWSDLGPGNASDAEIMAFARMHDCVVLTHDLDFSAILAATHGEKPSDVQIRSGDVSPEAVGQVVVGALGQMAEELESGALLSVEPNRMRMRLLPIQSR